MRTPRKDVDPGASFPMRSLSRSTASGAQYQPLDEPDTSPRLNAAGSELRTQEFIAEVDGDKDDDVEDTTFLLSEDPLALGVPISEKRFWWQRSQVRYNADAIATQPSVFDDPKTAEDYAPPEEWENYHRFDPKVRWTWREEHALMRKVDIRIMLFAAIAFMALELDRSNISQALTDNFLEDLGMTPNDYNLGNTVFKLAFLCAELPSQLIAKWIGPDIWIPTQMVVWSVIGSGQFFLQGRTAFLITRALLGMLQGGFIPEIILYLSYFYKHHELSLRLGFFWTASAMADVCGGFLAYGILHLQGARGQAGWRWLFLIEGMLTLVVGLLAAVLMPSSPTSTASFFRGRDGWFTVREEFILTNRVLRDDPSKSSMHNREPLTLKLFIQSFLDYDLWPVYILGLTFATPMATPQNYLTLTLKGMGFGTFNTNLLVIPSQIGHIVTMLGLTYASEVFGELTLTALIGQIWALPFIVFIYIVDITSINRWVAWFILTILLSYPYAHPIQVNWTSRNSNTVRSRTVSSALYNMSVQTSGIIAANIYRDNDAPRYKNGNRTLLLLVFLNIILYSFTKIYYIKRNAYKAALWNAMSEEERLHYISTTKDEGSKRLDFRFAH